MSDKHAITTEARALFQLSLPLAGAQLAQMGTSVADAVMAGRYGSQDLAGVALAGAMMWPITLIVIGILQAVTPSVAQYHGARAYRDIGEVIRQGLYVAITGGIVAALLLSAVQPIFQWMQIDPGASDIAVSYLRATSWGIPALMAFYCLRFLADGMSYTRPAMIIIATALILKIPLNYILIFGGFGIDAMGGSGCGVAQAIIMWFQFTMILLVVTRPRFNITAWWHQFSPPDAQRIGELLRVGVPIAGTLFAEVGMFSAVTLLLGRLGAETVASHNIAFNINGVAFMIPMALGMAATIRVGFRLGESDPRGARQSALLTVAGTVLVSTLSALAIFVFREEIVGLYTSDEAVATLGASLLMFVAFFLVMDAVQATALGALRGYKDTRVPMVMAIAAYWGAGLPVGWILGYGIGVPAQGAFGFWIGLTIAVTGAATLLCLRLWRVSARETILSAVPG